MRVFSIINNYYKDIVADQLEGLTKYFCSRDISIKLERKEGLKEEIFEIHTEGENLQNREYRLLQYYISNILYEVMIEDFISKKLRKYLSETYVFLDINDISKVKERVAIVLREEKGIDDMMLFCMNRKNIILDKISSCISEGTSINMKGFMDFRFNELKTDLFRMIEKVIEQYVVEKEYNEFISLLKYFVSLQESKVNRVDLYMDPVENKYELIDESGNNMMQSFLNEIYENKNIIDISNEDLVISGLITTCPRRIVIHLTGNNKKNELVSTIEKVFESRVEYCSGCSKCSYMKDFIKIPIDSNINL